MNFTYKVDDDYIASISAALLLARNAFARLFRIAYSSVLSLYDVYYP
jgi:hypothetical protein